MSRASGGTVDNPRSPKPTKGTIVPVKPQGKTSGSLPVSSTQPNIFVDSNPCATPPIPSVAAASAAGPSQVGKKSSHEKLIEKLKPRFGSQI